MSRDADSRPSRDPERRRNGDRRKVQRAPGPQGRAGMSGYGMDSIRRQLRVQLEQRRLLRPGPPPWDDEDKSNGADESS